MLAMRLRFLLPDHHLSVETKDSVKLAMGLVATMTALILGLMVASAKQGYDAQKADVIVAAAKFVMLDRMLDHYGPGAEQARELLRQSAGYMIDRLWPQKDSQAVQLDPSTSPGDALFPVIQALPEPDGVRASFKEKAMAEAVSLGEVRWLLYEQDGRAISAPLVVLLVVWIAILFFSFGLFAPANGTAITALLLSAFSVACAVFLILELDGPFEGLIHIPSGPMLMAITHLGK